MNRKQLAAICMLFGALISYGARSYERPAPGTYDSARLYERVAERVGSGEDYYAAFTSEVTAQAGAPTQVRSVRLPTSTWLIAWVPKTAWPGIEALFWAAALFVTGLMSRRPLLVVGCSALWLAISLSFGGILLAETFGLPFALYAVYAMRRGQHGRAAVMIVCAFAMRELYAGLLVLGILPIWRHPAPVRSWDLIGLLGRTLPQARRIAEPWRQRAWDLGRYSLGLFWCFAIYVLHARAARPHLSTTGFEPPFGYQGYNVHSLSAALGPLGRAYVIVGALLAFGVLAVALARRGPWALKLYVLGFAVLTAWSLRAYWQITYIMPMFALALGAKEEARDGN